jgi:hypothetical protein
MRKSPNRKKRMVNGTGNGTWIMKSGTRLKRRRTPSPIAGKPLSTPKTEQHPHSFPPFPFFFPGGDRRKILIILLMD